MQKFWLINFDQEKCSLHPGATNSLILVGIHNTIDRRVDNEIHPSKFSLSREGVNALDVLHVLNIIVDPVFTGLTIYLINYFACAQYDVDQIVIKVRRYDPTVRYFVLADKSLVSDILMEFMWFQKLNNLIQNLQVDCERVIEKKMKRIKVNWIFFL